MPMMNGVSPIELRTPTRTVAGAGAALGFGTAAGLLAAAGALVGAGALAPDRAFGAGWGLPPVEGAQASISRAQAATMPSRGGPLRGWPIIDVSSLSRPQVDCHV